MLLDAQVTADRPDSLARRSQEEREQISGRGEAQHAKQLLSDDTCIWIQVVDELYADYDLNSDGILMPDEIALLTRRVADASGMEISDTQVLYFDC